MVYVDTNNIHGRGHYCITTLPGMDSTFEKHTRVIIGGAHGNIHRGHAPCRPWRPPQVL